MAPEYRLASYWDERFRKEPDAYEWLVAPELFHDPVIDALRASSSSSPQVLHVGCGSSELSYHLRYLVDSPNQIHNVDFSSEALAIGRKHDDPETPMNWTQADLLKPNDILRLKKGAESSDGFHLIVDKSTVDAAACDYHRKVELWHIDAISLATKAVPVSISDSSSVVSKLPSEALYALHLAHITVSGGRWLCVSFSSTRFDFLDNLYVLQAESGNKAITFRFRDVWNLERREAIEVEDDTVGSTSDHPVPVHRPKIQYWMYILRRI